MSASGVFTAQAQVQGSLTLTLSREGGGEGGANAFGYALNEGAYASNSLITCPPTWLSCLKRPSWK
jgi:hypothetical protein